MAAETRPWSNLNTRIRLKLTKNYTFSMAAVFATYAYAFDKNGRVVTSDRTEWSYGRFGRFQGMSQNLSYTFNNETLSKLFSRRSDRSTASNDETDTDTDTDAEDANIDPDLRNAKKGGKQKNRRPRWTKTATSASLSPGRSRCHTASPWRKTARSKSTCAACDIPIRSRRQ